VTEKIASNAYQSILWWLIGIAAAVFAVGNAMLFWTRRIANSQ
jgi:nitrogen fixation-related uncharacterized protein